MRNAEHGRASKINARKKIKNMAEIEQQKSPEADVKKIIRLTAGGVIMNIDGDILLVHQKSGSWVFPKGGIEKGENPLVAAKREILEETGIEEKDLEQLADSEIFYDRPDSENQSVLQKISMFLFATEKMEVKPVPECQHEIAEARWVKKEEVANLLTAPKDKDFFLKILEGIK